MFFFFIIEPSCNLSITIAKLFRSSQILSHIIAYIYQNYEKKINELKILSVHHGVDANQNVLKN